MHADTRRWSWLLIFSALLSVHPQLQSAADAAWFDQAWPMRRAIDVTWDADRGSGEEIAYAEFYAVGIKDAGEVRVATEEGKAVSFEVLQAGPGDRVRVAFALQKGVKRYFVYWANPKPPDVKTAPMQYRRGLLLEMKLYPGGAVEGSKELRQTFDRAKDWIGKTMVERPFIGQNLLGEQQQTISRLTGQLFAPLDGEYLFALSADDRAAVFLNDKLLIYANNAPGDIRNNQKITLTRGPHKIEILHADLGGDWRLALGWKRPDQPKVDPITRDAFGFAIAGVDGPLEERNKPLVADFKADYLGEAWYAERLSFRYRFVAAASKADNVKYEWDFGDGQTASGQKVDHVFLSDGVYPIKLTTRIGSNADTRVTRFSVSRDFANLITPKEDSLTAMSKHVAGYDLNTLPAAQLMRAVWMHHRAENFDAMTASAMRLASLKKQADADNAYAALNEAAGAMITRAGPAAVEQLWAVVPGESNLAGRASRQRAKVLMWGLADFPKAAAVLKESKSPDNQTRRLLGMALVLIGQVDDGGKILRELPEQGEPEKRAALAGAMARSIEFFLDAKDPNAGDEQWDRWHTRYPADFLQGYSVVLKVRLIALHQQPVAAAKLAEAFALAVPKSSYAPTLLDTASKLLAKSDARKSEELKILLKQRYPEDPLSQ